MSYGLQYTIPFKNVDGDTYHVDILAKGYSGAVTTLEGSKQPFILKNLSSDNKQPVQLIRASEADIQFFNDSLSLSAFYNDDPNYFRVDFYYTQNGTDYLQWSGLLILDNCTEDIQDYAHLITLNATDNLGLLKTTPLQTLEEQLFSDTASVTISTLNKFVFTYSGAEPDIIEGDILVYNGVRYTISTYSFAGGIITITIIGNFPANGTFPGVSFTTRGIRPVSQVNTLTGIFSIALQYTGLQLKCNVFSNIFENTTSDRTISPTNDCFAQTAFYRNAYLNTDGSYKDLYTVINDILLAFDCTLFQANGEWNIVRVGEMYLFGNLPGTKYLYDFSSSTPVVSPGKVKVGKDLSTYPCNINQLSRILRPLQYVKDTFNFTQPPWIDQYNLQFINSSQSPLPAGLPTPFQTHTAIVSGVTYRYDDYKLSTYFKNWRQDDGDTSYLEVVTDISVSGKETEVDRYILQPAFGAQRRWVEFNPIPVSQGDSFDFSLNFKTPVDVGSNFNFWIRFLLIKPNGKARTLNISPAAGSTINVHWSDDFDAIYWDTELGCNKTVLGSTDSSKYMSWSLSSFVETNGVLPQIPDDGVLLIGVDGNNTTDGSEPQTTTFWKDIKIDFTQYIDSASTILGQVHVQQQPNVTKNNTQQNLTIDDSPRRTILGSLFTNALTAFDANIGSVYFTNTSRWHRNNKSESLRLGQLTSFEELLLQRKVRTIFEGEFKGLKYSPYPEISGTGTINRSLTNHNISLSNTGPLNISAGQTLNFFSQTYTITGSYYSPGINGMVFTVAESIGGNYIYSGAWTISGAALFNIISLLNTYQWDIFPGINFIIGISAIDFMKGAFTATFYEIYEDGETDSDLLNTYTFTYNYAPR